MDQLITANGISLDLKDTVPIPLNLAISDFKEPEKRQRNFSKEFDLPGTANNLAFFASAVNLTQIGGAYDFNSSAKVNCTYYKGGNAILPNAVLKLNRVTILDKVVTLKVGLYSDFVDMFLSWSDVDVRDLGWSDYTHALTNANIVASWSNAIGSGYYYPLIERNQRPGISQWRNTDMIPYVHLIDVFKRCMKFVGQDYTSSFLNTVRVKSLLYGYGGGNYVDTAISESEQDSRKVLLNNGTINFTQSIFVDPLSIGMTSAGVSTNYNQFSLSLPALQTGVPVMSFTETQDLYSQFIPNTFTAQRSGAYQVLLNGSFRVQYGGTSVTYVTGGSSTLFAQRNNVSTPILVMNQTSADQTFTVNLAFNLDLSSGDEVTFLMSSTTVDYTVTANTTTVRTVTSPVQFSLSISCLETALVEGSAVEMSRFIPSMKASDFVLGFIRLFQLQISDPDVYGVVRIEPDATFYQGTDVFTDITEEIDLSKEIDIRPSANEFAKTLTYKWKAATETDYKNYSAKWGKGYGDLTFDQPSYFAKGEQKIELPFATIVPYQITPQLIVPRFVDIDSAGAKKTTAGIPRLMFRNGMKTGNWQLVGTSVTDSLSTYPSVHHFDNWQNPTFDLNFTLVEELLHAATIVTTNNSYSVYSFPFVNEIISKEGKYVQVHRKINNLQIKQLDWSKLLMWNGALFRFNKIVDFDSEITEITKIEMIKVLEAKSANRRQVVSSTRKLPPIYALVKSPANVVATGVKVIKGGTGKQVLKMSKVIRG